MGVSVAATTPPLVDPSTGNLNLNARGGIVISFREQAAGVFLDISAFQLFFEIDGYARFQLTPGADDTEQLITLTDELVASLPLNTAIPFVVRNETNVPPTVDWGGMIKTYGYGGAPT